MHWFTLPAFKILSLSLSFNSWTVMCLSVVSLSLSYIKFVQFLELQVHVFNQTWEVFGHYFFKYSFCLFLPLFCFGTLIMYLFICLMVSHRSLRPVHFLHSSFFLFLSLNNFNFPIFKFTDFFLNWSDLLLNPLVNFSFLLL